MPRLFLAIDPPPAVADAMAELRTESLDGRWTDPEQYHLTLRFIGDVPEEKVSDLREAAAPADAAPFELAPSGLGVFPTRRNPSVVWTGLEEQPALFDLQERLENRLVEAGFDPEDRPFTPHITIARVREVSAEQVHRFLRAHEEFEAPSFRVSTYHLYDSELHPDGARHTRLETYSLTEAESGEKA